MSSRTPTVHSVPIRQSARLTGKSFQPGLLTSVGNTIHRAALKGKNTSSGAHSSWSTKRTRSHDETTAVRHANKQRSSVEDPPMKLRTTPQMFAAARAIYKKGTLLNGIFKCVCTRKMVYYDREYRHKDFLRHLGEGSHWTRLRVKRPALWKPRYICERCGKAFTRPDSLKRHIFQTVKPCKALDWSPEPEQDTVQTTSIYADNTEAAAQMRSATPDAAQFHGWTGDYHNHGMFNVTGSICSNSQEEIAMYDSIAAAASKDTAPPMFAPNELAFEGLSTSVFDAPLYAPEWQNPIPGDWQHTVSNTWQNSAPAPQAWQNAFDEVLQTTAPAFGSWQDTLPAPGYWQGTPPAPAFWQNTPLAPEVPLNAPLAPQFWQNAAEATWWNTPRAALTPAEAVFEELLDFCYGKPTYGAACFGMI